MKLHLGLAIVIAFIGNVNGLLFAQDSTYRDVFPLGLHYSFTYQYQASSSSSIPDDWVWSSDSASGTISYRITDSTRAGDLVMWGILVVWDIDVCEYQRTPWSGTVYAETSYTRFHDTDLVLYELQSGNHQLFFDRLVPYADQAWHFPAALDDSQSVYRYQPVDSSNKASLFSVSLVSFGGSRTSYNFSWKADSGLTQMDYLYWWMWGQTKYSAVLIQSSLTGVLAPLNNRALPEQPSLLQNYPNPFNPTTTIEFDLPNRTGIKIDIYNVLGQNICTLLDETKPAGRYSVPFDGSNLPSGVYFYRLQAGSHTDMKKMVMLR